jgi:hypothetical protein
VVDAWAINVVDVPDFFPATYVDAIYEILGADAFVAATIETMGNPNENYRWCCENPPVTLSDIEVLETSSGEFRETRFNGISYQDLPAHVEPGDRVHILLVGGNALYVFGQDEGIVHPVAVHQGEAINLLRVKAGVRLGYDEADPISPEKAIRWTWSRYANPWWGSSEHRLALALDGIEDRSGVCSAADMFQFVEYSELQGVSDELPPEVAATRQALIDASIHCDYTTLYEIGGGDEAALTSNSPYSFAGIYSVDDIAYLDSEYGLGRQLVMALTLLPHSTEETGDDDNPDFVYSWPPHAAIPDGGSLGDVWDDELISLVALLNDVTPTDLNESSSDFGAYAMFRVHISNDGTLLAAISGD